MATEILLENTDGVGAPPAVFSRGGTLLPSSYADARYIDAYDVVVSQASTCMDPPSSKNNYGGRGKPAGDDGDGYDPNDGLQPEPGSWVQVVWGGVQESEMLRTNFNDGVEWMLVLRGKPRLTFNQTCSAQKCKAITKEMSVGDVVLYRHAFWKVTVTLADGDRDPALLLGSRLPIDYAGMSLTSGDSDGPTNDDGDGDGDGDGNASEGV